MFRTNGPIGFISALVIFACFTGLAQSSLPGDLDTSFGPTSRIPGTVNSVILDSFGNAASGVAVQDDGRVVLFGEAGFVETSRDFALMRYEADGSLDMSFGDNGIVITDLVGQEEATCGVIQNDGKIIAAGFAWMNGSTHIAAVRYNNDGTIDDTFGDDGVVIIQLERNSAIYGITLQEDGKILMVGDGFEWNVGINMILIRLNQDGSRDTGFGQDGVVSADFGGSSRGKAVAVLPDGKILAGGTVWQTGWVFIAARYNQDGTPDTGFGENGKAVYRFDPNSDCYDMAVHADGRVILAGDTIDGSNRKFALVRFTKDGQLDTTFGDNGSVTTDFEGGMDSCRAVTVLDDDSILAAGGASRSGRYHFFAVAKYEENGQLDTSFGDNGLVMTYLWGGAEASAVHEDRLYVAGHGGYSPGMRGHCVAAYSLTGGRSDGPAPGANLMARQNKTLDPTATWVNWNFSALFPDTPPDQVIAELYGPFFGTVVENGDGSITYFPERNRYGYDAFIYTDHLGRVGVVTVFMTPFCVNDFNANAKTDLIAYPAADGTWQMPPEADAHLSVNPEFVIVSGDYTGNGQADYAFYSQSRGLWHIFGTDGNILARDVMWGGPGLQAVAGDYNGDGVWDMAFYDQLNGLWYAVSLDGEVLFWGEQWGGGDLVPVSGDYNGDGRFDLCLYSESTGSWFIRTSTGDILAWNFAWGNPGLVPVSGDFNGNGIHDLCLYSESSGLWFIIGLDEEIIAWAEYWGGPGLAATSGDFNGDGLNDLAVYDRNSGDWYVQTLDGELLFWNTSWGSN